MGYEEFRADYERVLDTSDKVTLPELAASIARLKALAETLTDPGQRFSAGNSIASLEDIYGSGVEDEQSPLSSAMTAASQAHSRAVADDGTTAERVARLDAAMEEIGRIAETADPAEQGAILDYNESLEMLRTALEPRTS